MKAILTKNLYVVKTRTPQHRKTERPLTDQERVEGWYDSAEQHWCDKKDYQANEGHELRRLYSMPQGHILTWEPQPGDQIQVALRVDFTVDYQPQTGGLEAGETADSLYIARWIDADLCREVHFPVTSRGNHERFVFCLSVLGRPVSLGEDGAEDAFGHDEIVRTLEAALDGDWRPAQCEYQLRKLPAEIDTLMPDWHKHTVEENHRKWHEAYKKFAYVKVLADSVQA